MPEWLDTETKAILEPHCPDAVSSALREYSLAVIQSGGNKRLVQRALRRIGSQETPETVTASLRTHPGVIVKDRLSHEAALMGQFELICADMPSVFLDSEVAGSSDRAYIRELIARLRQSDEFRPVNIRIRELPHTAETTRFLNQFFGDENLASFKPELTPISWKKARIMRHWAGRFGILIDVSEVPDKS